MAIVKIILIVALLVVFFQDIKERKVHWFWFPVIAGGSSVLLYKQVYGTTFWVNIGINLLFVGLLMLVVYLYAIFKLGVKASATFGLGDALLFVALSFGFSSVSFVILFVFGLLFSLLLHLVLKSRSSFSTVPLAGYLSLFFSAAYIGSWLGMPLNNI